VGSLEDPDRRFNDKGELVPYTDRMCVPKSTSLLCTHLGRLIICMRGVLCVRYSEDLKGPKQQACPFNFLYKDYDRKCVAAPVGAHVACEARVLNNPTSPSHRPGTLIGRSS
jgi:hypothetical protein